MSFIIFAEYHFLIAPSRYCFRRCLAVVELMETDVGCQFLPLTLVILFAYSPGKQQAMPTVLAGHHGKQSGRFLEYGGDKRWKM